MTSLSTSDPQFTVEFSALLLNPCRWKIRELVLVRRNGTQGPEGVCTDEFLSRKPGFLLSAMHSHAFCWFSCSLVFFPYSCISRFFVSCMEKNVGGLYLFGCKNYISLKCLNGFLAIFNFDNIFLKVYFYLVLVSSCKQLQENQGKKSAKTRKLGFLRNDCA